MSRRAVGITVILFLVFWAAWALLAKWLKPFPVAAYERIQLGMTREQVEAAIGMPSGNYDSYDGREWYRGCVSWTRRSTGLPVDKLTTYLNSGLEQRQKGRLIGLGDR